MLAVQSYLLKFENVDEALASLEKEYAVKATLNPDDDRVILNYNMIDSPKTHEIVRECRGLVLDKGNGWKLIAKAFTRFFNHCETEHLDFDWTHDVTASDKEDGSLILYYFYNGEWRVNTKGSFGHGEINDSGKTWNSLFNETINPYLIDDPELNVDYTYVFELCSVHNKVVRHYDSPISYLLTIFNGEDEIDKRSLPIVQFHEPVEFIVHSLDEAIEYIQKREIEDSTFEGIVVKDINGNRLKIKTKSYLQLHRTKNNGNIVSIKNIVPLILSGEKDEVLTYFPELKTKFIEIEEKIDLIKCEILEVWNKYKDIEDKKMFAISIISETKYTAPLFTAYQNKICPVKALREEYIIRMIENIQNNLH